MKDSIWQLFSRALATILFLAALDSIAAEVNLLRVPTGGIQPQALTDRNGALHLLFYKGPARAGNLFHARRDSGEQNFTEPVRVNQRPGSAIAVGTIRGAQFAMGGEGFLHVVWNGGPESTPEGDPLKAPLFYTRSVDGGRTFEPERNIITEAWGLDGGSSVAADQQGRVYVVWHAAPEGNTRGEAGRTVFAAVSRDHGQTFAPEKSVLPESTGVCGCCGLKAHAGPAGRVFVLYRAADRKMHRDQILLGTRGPDHPFQILQRHPWQSFTCPMSSAYLGSSAQGALAAWETKNQIYFCEIEKTALKTKEIQTPPGNAQRKHPAGARNGKGQTLLAWTEGTGWDKGGAVAWQMFDAKGRPTGNKGRKDGVPVWSLVAVTFDADGMFTVIY